MIEVAFFGGHFFRSLNASDGDPLPRTVGTLPRATIGAPPLFFLILPLNFGSLRPIPKTGLERNKNCHLGRKNPSRRVRCTTRIIAIFDFFFLGLRTSVFQKNHFARKKTDTTSIVARPPFAIFFFLHHDYIYIYIWYAY